MNQYKKIILAGGTGQIGNALCHYFKDYAEKVIVLSRTQNKTDGTIHYVKWDGKYSGTWASELNDADILINLAGKNVNCRYNVKNKKEIFDSRTNSIRALAKGLSLCEKAPKLWIQCASATIYRHAEDRAMTEDDHEIGQGFSVEVCKKWENTFWEETKSIIGMRKVVLRISLVLSPNEGVLPRLRNLTKFGLGGIQGNGQQFVSWIHEKDVVAIAAWLAENPEIEGTFNCTSPYPIPNKVFMAICRKNYGMPFGLPSPKWLLEIGAKIIGTETELILKSRWVLPEKLLKFGYQFQYPKLNEAIKSLVNG